jgi:L,D-transpeptidase catalytic domain
MQDVDPGIDHCNSDENVPYELKKWCFTGLSNRRAPSLSIPRSVICPTHAIRYGIGVGRAGFHLARLVANKPKGRMAGLASTPEMIERQPYLPRFMAGGPGNPPGAMYLGNTVYRIHGTNALETIGQAVSSGCFRLVNDDVIDLRPGKRRYQSDRTTRLIHVRSPRLVRLEKNRPRFINGYRDRRLA